MMSDKTDLFAALIVVSLGILGLCLAYSIESFEEEFLIGPRLVPMAIAWLAIGLGALQLALAWINRVKGNKANGSDISSTDNSKRYSLSKAGFLRIVGVIILGFVYIWLFSATGYLIATATVMAPLLVMFGTHKPSKVIVMTIVGTAVYYAVFIRLMGIYNPPGWLINF